MDIFEVIKSGPLIPRIKRLKSELLEKYGIEEITKITWLCAWGFAVFVSNLAVLFVVPFPGMNTAAAYTEFQVQIIWSLNISLLVFFVSVWLARNSIKEYDFYPFSLLSDKAH